jgi:hypothetical protein
MNTVLLLLKLLSKNITLNEKGHGIGIRGPTHSNEADKHAKNCGDVQAALPSVCPS